MAFLNVNQAAQVLGLNPQTIYRKISRGEIAGIRIGKTIRIDLEDLYRKDPSISFERQDSVPSFLVDLFWDVKREELKPNADIVLERVLELGDLGAVRWLIKHVEEQTIIDFLQRKGEKRLSPRSNNFWSIYFGLTTILENSQLLAKGTLGQARWR